MYLAYAVIHAERPKSVTEQRADDLHRGELAHAISRLLRRSRATAAPASSMPARPLTVRHDARRYA